MEGLCRKSVDLVLSVTVFRTPKRFYRLRGIVSRDLEDHWTRRVGRTDDPLLSLSVFTETALLVQRTPDIRSSVNYEVLLHKICEGNLFT